MAHLASKVSPTGPEWAHLGPFLATLQALLATWDVPLRIFMHFYQGFVNICAFLLKVDGKFRKIHKIALKVVDFTQKDRKGAYKCAKRRQRTPKVAQLASKVSPAGPKWAPPPCLSHFECTFGHLGVPLRIFMQFYQVFVNICAFLLKADGKFRKIHKIAL